MKLGDITGAKMNFSEFKKLQQKHLTSMYKSDTLFVTDTDKDKIWETYIEGFKPEHNKVFRERREYDCQCCKQFIRSFGNVVTIKNNQITTIWDFDTNDDKYQHVIDGLSKYVKSKAIKDFFITKDRDFGTDKNREIKDKTIRTWEHFYTKLPSRFVDTSSKSVGSVMGSLRDSRNVFERSLTEISLESVETVLDLISQKSLYKGDEWKSPLNAFLKVHKEYHALAEEEKPLYCWAKSKEMGSISKIKNHSIGVLLIDITEEIDLNRAVKRYEDIVAPHNYKRPKAIYTKKMVQQAQDKIIELGYLDSLARRHANIQDININDILFADKDSAKQMSGIEGVFEEMKTESIHPKKFDKVEEIPIEHFVNEVLPRLTGLEVLFENKHEKNLMSVIAPQNKSKSMFKWENNYSWSYNGNIADSALTKQVKDAGGRVDGALRFSHSWNKYSRNASLMDLHVFMPGSNQKALMKNGKEVHDNYGNRERVGWNARGHALSGGKQDVDYVDAAPVDYVPVENITFPKISKLKEGIYEFKIHNWKLRNPTNGGFQAEISFNDQVYKFDHQSPLENKEWITLAKIELKNEIFNIIEMAKNDTIPIETWGLKSNSFHPVSVCMLSPNYWSKKGTGNKHYFFILKGCLNQDQPNGFFNEYLKPELTEHKRVFEALGSKMKVKHSDEQLSGLGFSSTKRNSVVCRLKGHTNRIVRVVF